MKKLRSVLLSLWILGVSSFPLVTYGFATSIGHDDVVAVPPLYQEPVTQEEPAPDILIDESIEAQPEIVKPVVKERTYTDDELYCLAAVIYQEAGSDSVCDICRYRVGDVVLNRVKDKRFPNTIREVLEAKNQYGLYSVTGVTFPENASKKAVDRAYAVAKDLLEDENHTELYGEGYIWQAEFKQGSDIIFCDGIYFGK